MSKIIGTFTFYNETTLLVHQLEVMLAICDEIIMLSDNALPETLEIAEAYTNNKTVRLLKRTKRDNFNERDEWGDRQLLLQAVKERKGEVHYHTDADEIFLVKDIVKVNELVKNIKNNEVLYFPLNTFWGNAHNYRIPYNTSEFAGKQIEGIASGSIMPYFYRLEYATEFSRKPIPNFHAPRIPGFTKTTTRVDCSPEVLHYGYYTQNIVNNKKNFYSINTNYTGNVWGPDMQVDTKGYIDKWGMGVQIRK